LARNLDKTNTREIRRSLYLQLFDKIKGIFMKLESSIEQIKEDSKLLKIYNFFKNGTILQISEALNYNGVPILIMNEKNPLFL